MVVRVTVGDAGSAGGLIQRLLEGVEAEAISFEPAQQQVCIDLRRDSQQALARVLGAAEAWLDAAGHGPTKVEIDGHSCLLGPPTAVGGGR